MKIKLLFLMCILIVAPLIIKAQNSSDLGGYIGVSYYMGDVNKSKIFYSPKLAYGGMYRYNLNSRYAFKLSVTQAKLSGSDLDFKNEFQQLRQHEFVSSVTDISITTEFTFFDYDPGNMSHAISPYVAGGVAIIAAENSDNKLSSLGIPISFGLKFNITEKITAGIEWTYRKTFNDYLDKMDDATRYNTPMSLHKQKYDKNNNDWYSFCGFYLLYRLYQPNYRCPAYSR